jgi:hypothetical protein
MLRATRDVNGNISPTQQLEASQPAPAATDGAKQFAAKESDLEINNAMKALLQALQSGKKTAAADDPDLDEKPRRILLCLGEKRDTVAKLLTGCGYKVYIAQTPAQANERLRDGKTEIVMFSPDFASEYGGAAVIQQKANAMYSAERRRLFLVSLEEGGTTMNAQEAFIRNLNLIINTDDIPQIPLILNRALHDFNGLYHYLNRGLGLEPI